MKQHRPEFGCCTTEEEEEKEEEEEEEDEEEEEEEEEEGCLPIDTSQLKYSDNTPD
jgi:hypothetical protein